jgi:hypothetical protein
MRSVFGLVVSVQEDQKLDDYLFNLVKGLPDASLDSATRLLNYVINTQKRVLVHLKPFAFYQDKSFLKLDPNTIRIWNWCNPSGAINRAIIFLPASTNAQPPWVPVILKEVFFFLLPNWNRF